jgi:hypothetical protein
MKKKLFFKIFVFAVIAAFLTVTSCKDYDDDINKLTSDLAALKADLEKKIQDQKTTYDKTIGDLQTDLGKVKEDLKKAITQEGLDEALALYVKLEAFNKYKGDTDKSLKDLKEAVDKAATKEELANLQTLLEGKISEAKTELGLRIGALETLLDLKDGKLGVIEDIKKELAQHLEKINKNAGDIKALQEFLESDYESLKEMDETLRGLIDKKVDIETFNQEVERIDNKIDTVKKELEKKIEAVDKKLDIERLRINTLFNFTRQLKGLTFIPTRGLPAEKTMKLYYFAGDYTAEHVLIYRVSPSNSMYGRDFTIESLNYQVTTRSADDGVNDGSELVDVRINPDGKYYVPNKQEMQQGIKQFGDILYVPVHIQSEKPCEVYGNIDWWCNEYFNQCISCGDWTGLNQENFPAHVVKTIKNPKVDYYCGNIVPALMNGFRSASFDYNKGLSLVITAKAKNLDEKEGEPAEIRVKSTEHVNTQLIPTQIKLAESKGKGNEIVNENLTTRLLKFTLTEATTWANANENDFPNDNKNWNVLAWSGNQGEGGVWTPGKIDLNKYVSSFFYPQDGGDLSRGNTVPGDPHRYLWAEFGKEFGEPYFDKPHYAKPVYEFEQMIYRDTNHNIIIGPEGGEGVGNHYYATIEDGHFLTVINDPAKIQGIRNKKLIIKVTQVNSDCEERQPVGYLVIKYTDSPEGIWPDVDYTINLTPFPYYHKACGQEINGSKVIPQFYTDGDAGATFTHKNALLELFKYDRFMNPINAPESYGLSGVNNPGDVHFILAGNLQLNGIGEHNMGNIYNIQRRDATVVPGSVKFKAAANNHINDTENKAATGVTPEEAFRHVMIRYEYGNHSYIVYVDDHAPAGDYEITYLLENKEGGTQHGNRLFLTFKFKVALRDITVEHDKNTVNWQDDNKTIRVQHTRIHNSTHEHSKFKSDEGYRVDLKEAFILDNGTIDITTTTLPAIGGVNAGPAPLYRVKFEFIQDAAIKAAGFTYKRDAQNYLTEIWKGDELAAQIMNDPADGFNYLYIKYNKAGDLLYNYLMQDMLANNDLTKHNVWTKWGKTELMLKDDMERLLPVRMVTDINGDCGWPLDVQIENPVPGLDFDRFPNGNYYYIDDFNIKFERALRWAFTTVELTDDQQIQLAPFTFFTKYVDPEDEGKSVYRGLFDHAYYGANPPAGHVDHGYGNVVYPGVWWTWTPYTFTNPRAQAEFYGVDTRPDMLWDMENWHTLVLKPNQLPIPLHPDTWLATVVEQYRGLDYSLVEISTDGGATWQPAPQDYFVLAHGRRYFNVIKVTYTIPLVGTYDIPVAIWQGNQTAITSPIYFRVPVVNQTAIDNGYAPDGDKNYWMTFRHGHAKVKGYAVFKINPRQ